MIDIVFSDSFASTLKYYYQKRHIERQVLAMPMYSSLGDISDCSFIESRKTVCKIQYAHYKASEQLTAEAVDTLRKSLHELSQNAHAGECFRVWWSENSDDYCGFLWLCDYLKDFSVKTVTIKVPMTFVRDDHLMIISQLGEISEEDIDQLGLFSLQSGLSTQSRRSFSYYWRDLRSENHPIRTVINGNIIGQSIDFYDRFVLANLSRRRFRNIIRVIGETLGDYPFAPEWWYRHRIDYLVSKGSVDYKNDPNRKVGKIKLSD
ncbi:DUF1835 domain-containing protein [Lentilactobacillus parakefiri]|uniref:DUF1835 domain-containing protein n=2 Tax=Lentilactobacillus parakefiri TaxID=152332 RepID=A0A224VEI8_9LACO|nr:DUF1835 domain-containing protein [Lentilactobacillus parakefiri]KRL52295.1 hypothetical protein FD08_GL000195 [Lentilactobacillus parakefiri DSM 10551]PAK99504.1 hypothetical protein B8W96_11270 [Lentilactobacillus parakefiri]TDG90533.1 hypothetical protein C5L28_001190 [Lentilactobacillus parakefiri]GAW70992.1 hypothetical protein LPKJCM_00063 [Lentilactobacillus parakefiri]